MSPLARTLIHRLVASLVVLAGVSMLMFVIARVIPGDPARIALGPNATEAQVEALRHERHLDQPIPVQYWEYVREVAHGNLGNSLYSNRPVRQDIAQYLPATLELIFIAAAMIVLIGIPVGVLSARYRGRLGDHLGQLGSIMGVSTPAFVWGVILQLVFAYFWRLFRSRAASPQASRHLRQSPASSLSIPFSPATAKRSSILCITWRCQRSRWPWPVSDRPLV